jgi:hypothetical protein
MCCIYDHCASSFRCRLYFEQLLYDVLRGIFGIYSGTSLPAVVFPSQPSIVPTTQHTCKEFSKVSSVRVILTIIASGTYSLITLSSSVYHNTLFFGLWLFWRLVGLSLVFIFKTDFREFTRFSAGPSGGCYALFRIGHPIFPDLNRPFHESCARDDHLNTSIRGHYVDNHDCCGLYGGVEKLHVNAMYI